MSEEGLGTTGAAAAVVVGVTGAELDPEAVWESVEA